MFMTDCYQVYGNNTSIKSNNAASVSIAPESDVESSEEKGKGMETATKAAKAFLGAHVAAAKFAGGAVSKLSKKAVDYAKSDDASEKIDFVKGKAGSAFSGLKNKASAFADNHKKSADEKISAADEYDIVDSHDVSPNETVYQSNEKYEYGTHDSPAPTLNVPQNQGYIIQKQKTSPVLIIVIIILALIVGVLGGMLFITMRNNKPDDSNESAPVSDVAETTAEITEAATESETQTTVAATSATTTTQTTNSIPDQYTSDEISSMFSAYIAENPDPNRAYDNSDYGYALIDLNSDGTQELLITEGEKEKGSPWIIGVYAIANSKLTLLMGFDIRFPGLLCEDNIISYYSSLGQGGGTAFYKYKSGDSLDMIDIVSFDYSSGNKVMYHNSDVITEGEADSIISQYKPIQFEPKPLKLEKSIEVSKPDTPTLNNTELGRMYNEFYIYSLHGYVSGGYIEDYNGDGVDDLIFWSALAGYSVVYYKNGTLESVFIPGTSDYDYDEPLSGMKTQYYACDILPDKCREKAVNCGFTINKDFYMDSTNLIGYIKTNDINGTLNLRSEPNTDSDVLVQLPNGKLFNVIPEPTGNYGVYGNNDWYYISVNQNGNNYKGYISADYAVAWDNAI